MVLHTTETWCLKGRQNSGSMGAKILTENIQPGIRGRNMERTNELEAVFRSRRITSEIRGRRKKMRLEKLEEDRETDELLIYVAEQPMISIRQSLLIRAS